MLAVAARLVRFPAGRRAGVSALLGRSAGGGVNTSSGISSDGLASRPPVPASGLCGCLSSSVLTESEGSCRAEGMSCLRGRYTSPGGAACAPAAMYIKPNRAASTMSVVRRLTALLRFLFPILSAFLLFKARMSAPSSHRREGGGTVRGSSSVKDAYASSSSSPSCFFAEHQPEHDTAAEHERDHPPEPAEAGAGIGIRRIPLGVTLVSILPPVLPETSVTVVSRSGVPAPVSLTGFVPVV